MRSSTVHRRRRVAAAVAAAMISLTAVSACASADDEPTGTSTGNVEAITITIQGDEVDPNGKRFDIDRDQPVTLTIEADKAGELHVHSKPEQEIEYDAGESTHELSFDKPGIVAVESHALEKTILEFKVS